MADMSDLRSALATEVENLLTTVDSAYSGQVVQYYRDETDSMPSLHRIREVMGDPVRYAEVLHVSDVPDSDYFVSERIADGSMHTVPQMFQIAVWREYTDANTVGNSSRPDWDALIWDSPDGLLHVLRTGDMILTSGSDTYHYGQLSPAQEAHVPLNGDGTLIAHYVEASIEITGY